MSDTNARQQQYSASELQNLACQVLDEARKLGASAAEAAFNLDSGLAVTVRKGEVETVEHTRDRGMGVTVYVGQRKGTASTSDFSAAAIKRTVQAARDIARYTAEDACAGLADAELMATEIPDLDLYHPWDLQAGEAIELARACEAAAFAVDKRLTNSEGASVNSHQGRRVYANSHGFCAGYPSSEHSLSCVMIGEQDGQMQRDYWYTDARAKSELEDAEQVGRRAGERTVARLGARRVATGRYPVLYAAEVAGSLLRHLVTAIQGGNLYKRSSFLLDAVGEQLFPEFVRIHEQPHMPRGMGSAPFDNEGVATRARDVVSDGVLRAYVLGSYSARKLGLQTTGNAGGVHNLILEPGAEGFQELLARMGTGLLVTELMGSAVNIVTGDYSRGAAGYWVEGGELRFPVEEVTIAGKLRDMFKNMAAAGSDLDRRGNIVSGSILLREMTIAGE